MNKVQRLEKLQKLLKIREQDVLAEFKQLQKTSNEIKMQINDLSNHGIQSEKKLMQNPVVIDQLTLVKNFNAKIEVVIEQLNVSLANNDKNFLIVADKIKELRTSLTSIERLTDKYQLIESCDQEKRTQKQIEENINYNLSTSE
ncbi:MAG: hypothetical protein R8G33_01695 [Gammaproteobacteria bacterium]|nr:hypothetical protein [Gammaproteobacteria bacterium]